MIGPFDHEGKRRPVLNTSIDAGDGVEDALVEPKSGKRKHRKSKGGGEADDSDKLSSQKRSRSGTMSTVEEDAEEPTLGKRLEELSRQMSAIEKSSAAFDSEELIDNQQRGPNADSLVTLLDQAIQSGDVTLLEQCLQCNDLDVIDATTRRLATHRVLKLLRILVTKFEKRPSRGLLVTRWISCILKNHLSFLITVPDLSNQLAGLSQMLEQRLQSYTRLSSLAGRLDLLMAQVSSRKESKLREEAVYFQPKAVQEED